MATTRSQARAGRSVGGSGSLSCGGRGRRGRGRSSSSPLDKITESAIVEGIADGELTKVIYIMHGNQERQATSRA